MRKLKNKSPFRGFTLDEVLEAESNSFVIQLGNNFYEKEGSFTFSIKEAEKYYDVLLDNILYTIDNGAEKQRKAALSCLATLKILPLRLH